MADLGQAYVQIVPSADGISGKITEVLTPEAEQAGSSAGKSIAEKIGSSLQGAGKAMTAGITAPIAAIGGASIAAFSGVHGGLETIIQKTGATGDALDSMKGILGNITSSMPTDFATAGAAIGEVNTRFGVTGEELEKLSGQFIKFADLNGTDVSQSIDTVQSAMAAFGLKTSDAGAFLDTLNKAGQDTGVSVDKLASDLMTNAASLQEMGYNASDAASFIANLNKNGIDSNTVMAGMRKAFANSVESGKTMSEAMGDLQTTMQNAGSDTEAYQSALDLFGNRAGPAIAKAVADGRLQFDALGTSIEDNIGNVSRTFDATQTPMDDFKKNMNLLKSTGAELGGNILTLLQPAIEKLGQGIQKISDWWNSLSPQTKDMILKIAGIAAAIGPLALAIGTVIKVVTAVKTAIMGVKVAMAALSFNPVILAIMGIITAVILVIKNWDKIKAAAQKLWAKMKEVFGKIKDFIVGVWNNIKETASTVWEAIKTAVMTPINALKGLLSSAWNGIKATAKRAWEGIKGVASTVWGGIKSVVTKAGSGIRSGLSTAWSTVKSNAQNRWTEIKSVASTVWNGTKDVVTKAGSKMRETLGNTWDKVKSKASSVWESVKSAITKPIASARDTIKGIVDKIKGFFSFDFTLPKIKLPHFTVEPAGWKLSDLLKGSIPKLGISWYAKGGIVDGATLIGAGERGPEGIIPLSGSAMRPFAHAIASEMGGDGVTVNLNYSASDDANDMLRDLVRGVRRYKRAGAF